MTYPQQSGDQQEHSTWSAQSGSQPPPDQAAWGDRTDPLSQAPPDHPVTPAYPAAPGYAATSGYDPTVSHAVAPASSAAGPPEYPVSSHSLQPVYPAAGQPTPPTYPAGTGYPAPGYPSPYGYQVARPTNGVAIASLVVSILAVAGLACYGLGGYLGLVGAVLGHVSRRQIRQQGGDGDGMALAGVIMGWLAAAIALLVTVGIVAVVIGLIQASEAPTGSTF